MPQTLKPLVILLLILLCGFGLRTGKALQFDNLEHDDQISLLAAAGHLGEYAAFAQDNAHQPILHTAHDWQRFLHPEPGLDFFTSARQISADLRQHDIHPPLYFIWLHWVMQQVERITPVIGWISNAGFFVLNGLLLFWLALRLSGDASRALLATFIWCVAPAAIRGSVVARHYELLTLFTLVSTLVLLPALQRKRLHLPGLLAYSIVAGLGFLANYQFLYHLAALSLLILLAHHSRPMIVLTYAVATLAALGLALYLYPALLQQTRDAADGIATMTGADIRFRLRNTLEELAKYCLPGTLVLLAVLVRKRDWLTTINHRIWLLALINLLALAGAYLAFISPRHAMGGRYMASLGPFLSILFAAVLFAFWQQRLYRAALVVLILLPALLLAKKPVKTAAPPPELRAAALVVADFDMRGVWPGIFLHLKPNQPVLVAPQQYLLTQPDCCQPAATGPVIWISNHDAPGNNRYLQKQLRDILQQKARVETLKTRSRTLRFYRITATP